MDAAAQSRRGSNRAVAFKAIAKSASNHSAASAELLGTCLSPKDTTCDKHIEVVSRNGINQCFDTYVQGGDEDAVAFRKTLQLCKDAVAEVDGGCLLVVLHAALLKELRIDYADGGLLKEFARSDIKSIFRNERAFRRLLSIFCTKTYDDLWKRQDLSEMMCALLGISELAGAEGFFDIDFDTQPHLKALLGHSKEGAFVVTHRGDLVCAAAHLKHQVKRRKHPRTEDDTKVSRQCSCNPNGLRFDVAIGVMEWLESRHYRPAAGVAFSKSESGALHVLIPGSFWARQMVSRIFLIEDDSDGDLSADTQDECSTENDAELRPAGKAQPYLAWHVRALRRRASLGKPEVGATHPAGDGSDIDASSKDEKMVLDMKDGMMDKAFEGIRHELGRRIATNASDQLPLGLPCLLSHPVIGSRGGNKGSQGVPGDAAPKTESSRLGLKPLGTKGARTTRAKT